MPVSRRNFLLGSMAATAASLLVPAALRRSMAGVSAVKRNLIIVMAQGGWDATYALDPKPNLAGVDAPDGTVAMFGDIPIFVDASRPSVEGFFDAYGDRAAVVRGINVRSIAHPECRKRLLTGTPSAANADFGAIVGHANGNDLPMPYLILGNLAFTGPYASSAGRVGTTNQLKALLDPADAYPSATRFVPGAEDDALISQYVKARAERARAVRGQTGYNRKRLDDFLSALDRGDALKPYSDDFGERGITLAFDAQLGLAVDALDRGIARSVMVDTGASWDTHDNNQQQNPLHEQLYQGLLALAGELDARPGANAGSSLLDETVVVAVSEMTRTPKLNASAGKDHWPVASALVFGGGVAGGRALGGTSDQVESELVDLSTGRVSTSGVQLQCEHFAAGLISLLGIDPSGYFPGVEALHGLAA